MVLVEACDLSSCCNTGRAYVISCDLWVNLNACYVSSKVATRCLKFRFLTGGTLETKVWAENQDSDSDKVRASFEVLQYLILE